MKSPVPKSLRRACALLLWLALGFGLLHEAAQWTLKASLRKVLFVASPQAEIHALSLSADSPWGEGSFKGVGVRWRGARIALLRGGELESLEIGPPVAPILAVRNLRLSRVWPMVVGGADAVEISPFRPEWRRLLKSEVPRRKGEVVLPLRVFAPSLTLALPGGIWEGPASIEGESLGKRGRLSADLAGAGGRLCVTGSWEGPRWDGQAALSGNEGINVDGRASWDGQRLDAWGIAARGQERWTADLRFDGGRSATVVAAYQRPGAVPQALACGLLFSAQTGLVPHVEHLAGQVKLPDIQLGDNLWFREGALTAQPASATPAGEACVSVLGRGRLGTRSRSYLVKGTLEARDMERSSVSISFEGSAAPAPSPLLADRPESLFWRASCDASPGPSARLRAFLKAGKASAQGSASFDEGGWTWASAASAPSGEASAGGEWRPGSWNIKGAGEWAGNPEAVYPLPMPKGPLRVTLAASGSGDEPWNLQARANGAGSWAFTAGKAGWSCSIRGGALSGKGIEARGIGLQAAGEGFPAFGSSRPLRVDLAAESLSFGGEAASGVRLSATSGPRGLTTEISAQIDSLPAKVRAKIDWPGGKSQWRLAQGLFDFDAGTVLFDGISASWPGGPSSPALWECPGARIYGEKLDSVSGSARWDSGRGNITLDGKAAHWGGTVTASLPLGSGVKPLLRIAGTGIAARPILPYIKQWVELPLRAKDGSLDAVVEIPLDVPDEGLKMEAALRAVDLEIAGPERVLTDVSGPFSGLLSGGQYNIPPTNLTLKGGAVPVAFSLRHDGADTRVAFEIPQSEAQQIQSAAFDFLPEFMGYAEMKGPLSLKGTLDIGEKGQDLLLRLEPDGLDFASEDKSLRARGLRGVLVLPLVLEGERGELEGYASPGQEEFDAAFEGLGDEVEGASLLSAENIQFSVFSSGPLVLQSLARGFVLTVRLVGSDTWAGGLRGEIRLAMAGGGIRYAGQGLIRGASLTRFCQESEALKGFITGTANAGLTVAGEDVSLARSKALVDLWVDPAGKEPRIISRDFLVKMGGERIRSLLHSDRLEYDRAKLRCGLSNGLLSVYDLELFHEANPVKALIRKDVSFTVKVPARNSITLDQLVRNIKNLEVRTGIRGPLKRHGE